MTNQTKLLPNEYSAAFLRFWDVAWRKKGKNEAWRAWQKQRIDGDQDLERVVIGDVKGRNQARAWHPNPTKNPMPATWLNGRRWEDDWQGEVDAIRAFGTDRDGPQVGKAPARPARPPTAAELKRQAEIDAMDPFETAANRFLLNFILSRYKRGRTIATELLLPNGELVNYKRRAARNMQAKTAEAEASGGDLGALAKRFAVVMRENFDRICEGAL